MIRIALPNKGRLADGARDLLERAGLEFEARGERALLASLGGEFLALFVRAQDIPEFVADGAAFQPALRFSAIPRAVGIEAQFAAAWQRGTDVVKQRQFIRNIAHADFPLEDAKAAIRLGWNQRQRRAPGRQQRRHPQIARLGGAASSSLRLPCPRRCQRVAQAAQPRRHALESLCTDPFAEIAAHDEHAVESLHLEAHLELDVAVLVALLGGLAGLENAAHGLQHVRGHLLGPQRADRASGDVFAGWVHAAHRLSADAGEDHAVAAHDERQVGQ